MCIETNDLFWIVLNLNHSSKLLQIIFQIFEKFIGNPEKQTIFL